MNRYFLHYWSCVWLYFTSITQ